MTTTIATGDAQPSGLLAIQAFAITVLPMVIALAGQKGGSGKTTTAICLASEWHARGRRVLLVDADPQGTSRTWADVAAEAGRTCPAVVSMGPGLHRPDQLPALAQAFEYTVIDCPPRHGDIQRAALMVADLVIVPCGPSSVDAWALGGTIDLIEEARVVRPQVRVSLLITRKVARTSLGSGARDILAASKLPVLDTELGYRVAFQEAPAAGMGVTTYAPGTPAAAEAQGLVDEVERLLAEEMTHAVA